MEYTIQLDWCMEPRLAFVVHSPYTLQVQEIQYPHQNLTITPIEVEESLYRLRWDTSIERGAL